MNDIAVKAAVDQFMRRIGPTARNEIEKVVRTALANGKLAGKDSFNAEVAVSSDQIGLNITIYGKITL